MTEFAHTYKNVVECASNFVPSDDAEFTLVLYMADGGVKTVDSNELPAYADENRATSAAMFAVKDLEDSCDVYHYGGYYGTAEYVDMNPESWFSSIQVVFSMPY